MGTLSRYKFWIVMGGAAFLSVALFLLVWLPAVRENRDALENIEQKGGELQRLARGDVRDEEWVQSERERYERLQEVLEDLKADLRKYYPDLAADIEAPETSDQFWAYVDQYEERMQALLEDMEGVFAQPPPPLITYRFEDTSKREEFPAIWKKMVAQRAIIDVLIDQNKDVMKVPILHGITMDRPYRPEPAARQESDTRRRSQRDQSPAPRQESLKGEGLIPTREVHAREELFDIWPFQIELTMPFIYVPDLVEGLLQSPYAIEVVILDLERERVEWEPDDDEEDMDDEAEDWFPEDRRRPGREWDDDPYWYDEADEPEEEPEDEEDEEPAVRRARLPHDGDMSRVVVRGYIPEYKGYEEGK